MTNFQTHIKDQQLKQRDVARQLGISGGYLSELVNGIKTPSLDLAVAIERLTQGAVPAASWVPDAPAAEPQEDAA